MVNHVLHFLEETAKRSNIEFNYYKLKFKSFIHFLHEGNQCSIVQFSSRNLKLPKSKLIFEDEWFYLMECQAYFVAEISNWFQCQKKQIKFIIKGNFGKYPRKVDSVQLLGEPEKLDVYSPQLNYTGNRYNEKIFSSCHIYAQINSSDKFQIKNILSLHSNSWIDIIVKDSSLSQMGLEKYNLEVVNFEHQPYELKKNIFGDTMVLEFGGNSLNEFTPSGVRLNIDTVQHLRVYGFDLWDSSSNDNGWISYDEHISANSRICNSRDLFLIY